MNTEQWAGVPGLEDRYLISDRGRVKSLISNTYISPFHNNSGYWRVTLRAADGSNVKFYVHRLVAMKFVQNPGNKKLVNHIDEDKQNNSSSNLEWVSSSENVLKARANNPQAYQRRQIYCADLNFTAENCGEMADELIRRKLVEGGRPSVLARINNIINGHSKSGTYYGLTFEAL